MSIAAEIQKDIVTAVRSALEGLISDFQDELRQQGHVLTGSLVNSMELRIVEGKDQVIGTISFQDYGAFVERGVPAPRIPFSRSSGRGGTSKYIQGLIRFFQIKGLPGNEAIRAAFATANKHKREGMPTRASYRFSSNGARTGFVTRRLAQAEPRIVARVSEDVERTIEIRIFNLFTSQLA